MKLTIPKFSLVAMVGTSGSGKSTFARKHFKPTEIISSDHCRGLVSDDETDQSATKDAFDIVYYIASKRLARGRLTVIDATNVQHDARRPILELAGKYRCVPVAIVLNVAEQVCHERNSRRPDRDFGPHVVRQQYQNLQRSLPDLESEGFRYVYVLSTPDEIENAVIERQPLLNDCRDDQAPLGVD